MANAIISKKSYIKVKWQISEVVSNFTLMFSPILMYHSRNLGKDSQIMNYMIAFCRDSCKELLHL